MATTAKKNTTDTTDTTDKTENVENTEASQNPLNVRVERLFKAHDSVKNYTMSAVAVGLVPAPLIDMAGLMVIQLKMLHGLSRRYNVPFSKNAVKSLISSLVGGSAAISIALPLGSLFKAVPVIGQTSGMISTSIIGASSTYAIGKVFVAHFESGGTFLNFNVEKANDHFKELYEEGKAYVKSKKADEKTVEEKG